MTEAWLGTFGRSTVEVGLDRRRSEEIMLAGERRAVAERERRREPIKDGERILCSREIGRTRRTEDQPFCALLTPHAARLLRGVWCIHMAHTPGENFLPPHARGCGLGVRSRVTLLTHEGHREAEAPSPAPAASPEGAERRRRVLVRTERRRPRCPDDAAALLAARRRRCRAAALEPSASAAPTARSTRPLALMAAASTTAQVRERALVELVLLFGSLGCRAELHPGCLVHALILVENAIRAGLRFDVLSLRPLAVAAVVLASKYHYDETMHLKDFRDAVPHLKLRRLAQLEVELCEGLRFRLVVWDEAVWTQYGVGLASLLAHYHEEVEGFRRHFGASVNEALGAPLLALAGAAAARRSAVSVGVFSSAPEPPTRVVSRHGLFRGCSGGIKILARPPGARGSGS